MEGVFRFKSWFQNAHGLIRGGTYRNFTVGIYIYIGTEGPLEGGWKILGEKTLQYSKGQGQKIHVQ